jgi:hypothetical protein
MVGDQRMDRQPETRFEGDTSPEALRVQFAALRRLTVAERLALMDDLTMLAQTMAREGLKQRNPGATESELDLLFSRLVLGPDLASRVLAHRQAREESSDE